MYHETDHCTTGITCVSLSIHIPDEIFRLGLTAVLATMPMIKSVHECAGWDDAARVARTGASDILIVTEPGADIRPELAGPWTGPDGERHTKVLMLLRDQKQPGEVFTGPLSPDGFLIQGEMTAESLTEALRKVSLGEMPIPPALVKALMEQVGAATPPRRRGRVSLTARERETLTLLGEGLSNKQIARRLSISNHGAKRIVANLLLKLDCPNRTMAVVTAIQNGLITTGG